MTRCLEGAWATIDSSSAPLPLRSEAQDRPDAVGGRGIEELLCAVGA